MRHSLVHDTLQHSLPWLVAPLTCLIFTGCEGDLTDNAQRPEGMMDMSIMPSGDLGTLPDGGPRLEEDMPTSADMRVAEDMRTLPDGGMVGEQPCIEDMYTRLEPTCKGCHDASGGWKGFASLTSFENLLIYNTRWVELGDPSQSALLPMLRGEGEAPLTQMPLGLRSFAQLEADGDTQITIAEIEACITQLTPRGQVNPPLAPTIRIKSAEQILNALHDQLGLDPQDFFGLNDKGIYESVRKERYPILNPDSLPSLDARQRGYTGIADPFARWENIGGGNYANKRSRRIPPSISQGLNLVQISQAWCRLAVQKSGNDEVLRHVTLADQSASAPDDIRRNIAYLHLRMLGEPAGDEVVQELYDDIYLPYEQSDGGTETAWTAVCASLIRDPLWLTY